MRISDWSSDVCSSDLDEQGRYGEIVVTGDRANRFGTDTVQSGSFRNAKILDVPLTISVIPSEVLKSQQAVDLIDAVRNTAGVSTTGTGPFAYNNLTVRCISFVPPTNFLLFFSLNILSSSSFPLFTNVLFVFLLFASALYSFFSSPSFFVHL